MQIEQSCLPITALHEVRIFQSTLLLAGQGRSLYLIEGASRNVISSLEVFNSQAIHGISSTIRLHVSDEGSCVLCFVLLWGGPLFQILRMRVKKGPLPIRIHDISVEAIGKVTSAHDWILDAAFSTAEDERQWSLTAGMQGALITANNALVHFKVSLAEEASPVTSPITASTIASGHRSILYSAHVVWLARDHVLVASGTVFGEVLVWSCRLAGNPSNVLDTREVLTHYIFKGHEGSVFGVHISQQFKTQSQAKPIRLLSSCSDDRSIRIWDISDCDHFLGHCGENETSDSRGTGFIEAGAALGTAGNTPPLTTAWGHISRIWDVRFLSISILSEVGSLTLVSRGEDATLHEWKVSFPKQSLAEAPLQVVLDHVKTTSQHSGKNVWSWNTSSEGGLSCISTGGADGSISATSIHPMTRAFQAKWTPWQVLNFAGVLPFEACGRSNGIQYKEDQIKQYGFITPYQFLAISQSGVILLGDVSTTIPLSRVAAFPAPPTDSPNWISWENLGNFEDLGSYSIISTDTEVGIAVFGGVNSMVRCYYHLHRRFYDISSFTGKVTGLFILHDAEDCSESSLLGSHNALFSLIITLANSKVAYVLTICFNNDGTSSPFLTPVGPFRLPLFDTFDITSALHLPHRFCLVVGSRTGSYGFYNTTSMNQDTIAMVMCVRSPLRKDTVTSIMSLPSTASDSDSGVEYILTCGRDSAFRITSLTFQHHGQFSVPRMEPAHESSMPLGPNLEGTHFNVRDHDILIYGFRGKEFVVWNDTKQQEIMAVDCGGAHRSWAYSPPESSSEGSGTFLWTKASTFNLFSQPSLPSRVIQRGGHGREIKSISISDPIDIGTGIKQRLLATGAEDTTIRISSLSHDSGSDSFPHLRTLKKHTTGIQNLQWSPSGTHLFSSGGCSEFLVWHLHPIPTHGIGIVCEAICPLSDSENPPDLRITSFDILAFDPQINPSRPSEQQYLIAMALSNCHIKLYHYSSHCNVGTFTALSSAPYSTNTSLTNIRFLSSPASLSLYAATTSGHTSAWSLSHLLYPDPPPNSPYPSTTLTFNPGTFNPTQIPNPDRRPRKDIYWHARKAAHQSSVKCMVPLTLSANTTMVVTGGDDNSLAFTLFTTVHHPSTPSASTPGAPTRPTVQNTITALSTLSIPHAHASAITALAVLPSIPTLPIPTPHPAEHSRLDLTILTASNDQRLKTWDLTYDPTQPGVTGLSVNKGVNMYSDVADASDLGVSVDELEDGTKDVKIVLVGVGIELWTWTSNALVKSRDE